MRVCCFKWLLSTNPIYLYRSSLQKIQSYEEWSISQRLGFEWMRRRCYLRTDHSTGWDKARNVKSECDGGVHNIIVVYIYSKWPCSGLFPLGARLPVTATFRARSPLLPGEMEENNIKTTNVDKSEMTIIYRIIPIYKEYYRDDNYLYNYFPYTKNITEMTIFLYNYFPHT